MMSRHQYSALIRAAILDLTRDVETITLARLDQLLGEHLEVAVPSRVTLAKLLGTIGWRRVVRPDGGAIFARPAPIAATGVVS